MRIRESMHDLGAGGVLLLTLEGFGSWEPPINALKHGRARLYKARDTYDRLEVCTRALSRAVVEETLVRSRARLARAVATVQRRLGWLSKEVTDDFRQMPSQALPMGDGLMLLGFVAAAEPRIFRVVDLVRGEVRWEATVDEMQKAAKIASRTETALIGDTQILYATGGCHAVVSIQLSNVVWLWDGAALLPSPWRPRKNDLTEFKGTRAQLVAQPDRDRNEYNIVAPGSGKKLASFAAPTRSKGWTQPIASPGSERIALPHEGGTIDIVDGYGREHFSIRPYTRVGRKDGLACNLSFAGRYLGVRAWQSFRVVDLERRVVAEIQAPTPNMSDDPDKVIYDSDVIAAEDGVYEVYYGKVQRQAYDTLLWQPVVQPGKGSRPAAKQDVEQYLARWAKPALALSPGGGGRSRLYGAPDLPADHVPRHEGRPMLLLAQIDLAETAEVLPKGPWPHEGLLCFFIAVDAEGEPLVDDAFNPRKICVVWSRVVAPTSAGKALKAQPLRLSVHAANLPDIISALVESEGLEDPVVEAYRAHLEANRLADQPSGHRLGGYPTILQNNDLEAQAAYFVDNIEYPPEDIADLRAASRWRLLLQLDSDDNFMWGTDSGMLYFMIHDDDLARSDFSRVAAICEGH